MDAGRAARAGRARGSFRYRPGWRRSGPLARSVGSGAGVRTAGLCLHARSRPLERAAGLCRCGGARHGRDRLARKLCGRAPCRPGFLGGGGTGRDHAGAAAVPGRFPSPALADGLRPHAFPCLDRCHQRRGRAGLYRRFVVAAAAARRAVLRHRHRPGREPHRRGLVRLELFGRGLRRGAGCAAQPAEDHRHAAIGGDAGLLDHRSAARGGAGNLPAGGAGKRHSGAVECDRKPHTAAALGSCGGFRAGQCGGPQRRSRGVRQSRTAVGGTGAGAGNLPAGAARGDLDRHADR